jgi:FkbM family methyltransferase
MAIAPNQMFRVETPSESALWIFHNAIGEEGVLGLSVARPGMPPETACLLVSRKEHTQRVMHDLFREGRLYEKWTSGLVLGALRVGDIAIDIGAHVGLFSVLARLCVGASGMVFAFEPMPDTYRRLLHNVMYNRFTNVLPLPLAVSAQSGSAEFYIDPDNEGESSLVAFPSGSSCIVQMTSLDDIFRDALGKRPRLLKLDAEGVELSILQGGPEFFAAYAPDMVICECNRGALMAAGVSEWMLRRFFDERGYNCAVVNNGMGLDLGGGEYYRYLRADEESAPRDFGYVYNLMFVRAGSGLYPAPYL